MTRASKVITLVLLGSALALIGWACYQAYEDADGTHPATSHTTHFGHSFWFWGGGGSYSGGSAPHSSSGTVRGGFGGTGASAAVGG
jgi:hypothetical protein